MYLGRGTPPPDFLKKNKNIQATLQAKPYMKAGWVIESRRQK
jgi:hypothetical protein